MVTVTTPLLLLVLMPVPALIPTTGKVTDRVSLRSPTASVWPARLK